ncbi:MAG: 30S ribosomal protein S20 [Candidatus Paceibacterota bacterium]|jgi:small subunit ribosomal protein S20
MPIIKSAKKALRGSQRKKVYNDRRNKAMKGAIKDVKKLVVAKESKKALTELSAAYQAIDKAAKRGIIKKNTAARKKSRLAKFIKKSA